MGWLWNRIEFFSNELLEFSNIQYATRSVIDRLESMYSNHGGHIISTSGMHCEALIDDK